MGRHKFNSDEWNAINDVFEAVTDPATGHVIPTVISDLRSERYFDQFSAIKMEDGTVRVVHDDTGVGLTKDSFRGIFEESKPHWFGPVIQESLEHQAFLEGNLTAQGRLIKELGGGPLAVAQAEQKAARYGTRLGSTKKGTLPGDAVKTEAPKSTNPWSSDPANLDSKTGRYNAVAMRKQSGLVASLGLQKASGIASAANSFVGASSPKSRKMIGQPRRAGI